MTVNKTIKRHRQKIHYFRNNLWYVSFPRYFINVRKVHPMKKLTKKDKKLDTLDCALITALHQNARLSIRALSRQVGLSAPGCSERLRNLEDSGVIKGFDIELDAQALGHALQALVRIKPFSGKFQTVEQLLTEMAECVVCYKITGDDSFVCHLYTTSVSHLDLTLRKISSHADTNTSIIKTIDKKLPRLFIE
ncbi:Lrp/AsnC family transcriptional regulator [Pseudomonas sp. 18175]|uniref:Lrp/AsnC family transcriptional regulator n=1 Tax=Pseudomonas sp. 18175 TaxID=3390056 RepID=UPI003D2226B2